MKYGDFSVAIERTLSCNNAVNSSQPLNNSVSVFVEVLSSKVRRKYPCRQAALILQWSEFLTWTLNKKNLSFSSFYLSVY